MENNLLSMAMAAYRSNTSDENLGKLYQELLDAEYIVPVIFVSSERDPDSTKVNLFTMKNASGDRYYLVFSSAEELTRWQPEEAKETITLNFDELVSLLNRSLAVSGILIDPQSGNMVFEKELMNTLSEIDNEPTALS